MPHRALQSHHGKRQAISLIWTAGEAIGIENGECHGNDRSLPFIRACTACSGRCSEYLGRNAARDRNRCFMTRGEHSDPNAPDRSERIRTWTHALPKSGSADASSRLQDNCAPSTSDQLTAGPTGWKNVFKEKSLRLFAKHVCDITARNAIYRCTRHKLHRTFLTSHVMM